MFTHPVGFSHLEMVVAKFPSSFSSNIEEYHDFHIPSTGISFPWVLNTHTM